MVSLKDVQSSALVLYGSRNGKKYALYGGILSLSAGIALVSGCGGGGGGASVPLSSQGGTLIDGVVLAPASALASRSVKSQFFASLLRSMDPFGTPAEAASNVVHKALANAQVSLVDVTTGQPVTGAVTTNSSGQFQITIPASVPTGDSLEIDVTSADGSLELKAPVPPGTPSGTTITVDEVSTVGAQAEEQCAAAGQTPQNASQIAAQVENAQDQTEQAHPDSGHIPDLHKHGPAPGLQPGNLASSQLTANLGGQLSGSLTPTGPTISQAQALMGAITYVRVHGNISGGLLKRDWETALLNGPVSYTDTQLAAAFVAAGVTGATTQTVDDAITALNTALSSTISPTAIPVGAFVILALQPGSLQLTSLSAIDLAVNNLTGSTLAPPTGSTNGSGSSSGGSTTTSTSSTSGTASTSGSATGTATSTATTGTSATTSTATDGTTTTGTTTATSSGGGVPG